MLLHNAHHRQMELLGYCFYILSETPCVHSEVLHIFTDLCAFCDCDINSLMHDEQKTHNNHKD